MKLHVCMFLKKIGDLLCLVRRKIVEDDVNVLLGLAQSNHLLQKIHKLIAGVASRRFAVDLAAAHIQSGVERKRTMAIVLNDSDTEFNALWLRHQERKVVVNDPML